MAGVYRSAGEAGTNGGRWKTQECSRSDVLDRYICTGVHDGSLHHRAGSNLISGSHRAAVMAVTMKQHTAG
jgi:hypothetical protein